MFGLYRTNIKGKITKAYCDKVNEKPICIVDVDYTKNGEDLSKTLLRREYKYYKKGDEIPLHYFSKNDKIANNMFDLVLFVISTSVFFLIGYRAIQSEKGVVSQIKKRVVSVKYKFEGKEYTSDLCVNQLYKKGDTINIDIYKRNPNLIWQVKPSMYIMGYVLITISIIIFIFGVLPPIWNLIKIFIL